MENVKIDEGSRLKALISELEERINDLKLFDKTSEVNAHCDDLIGQVTLNIESAVGRLNKLQDEMIAKINCYRNRLLDGEDAPEVAAGTARGKQALEKVLDDFLQDADTPEHDSELSMMIKWKKESVKDSSQELARLSKDIASFANKCSHLSPKAEDLKKADELKRQVQKLRSQMRAQAFKGVFIRFNDVKLLHKDFRGKLEYSFTDTEDQKVIRHVVLDESVSKASSLDMAPLRTGQFISHAVTAVHFLQDDNIAVGIRQHPIFIWSPKTRQKLFDLTKDDPSDYNMHLAFAQLPSGHLVSSDCDSLDIWDLKARQHLSTFYHARRPVLSLKVLSNGDLVVFNGEGIYIWHLSRKGTKHLLQGSDVHVDASVSIDTFINWTPVADCILSCGRFDQTPCYFSQYLSATCSSDENIDVEVNLEELSDGRLALSTIKPEGVLIQVCKPGGQFAKEFVLPGANIDHCKIMPSGDVVVCLHEGIVQIYDLEDERMYQSFPNEQGLILDIRQNPDGSFLFVHLNDPKLPILKPADRSNSDYRNYTNSICMSNDGQRFAIGSAYGRVVIWPLKD